MLCFKHNIIGTIYITNKFFRPCCLTAKEAGPKVKAELKDLDKWEEMKMPLTMNYKGDSVDLIEHLKMIHGSTSKIIQTENPIQAPSAPPSADMKVVVV